MQQFSDRLKQAMEEHGYKQVDLIRLVNETGSPRGIHVGKSHISQYCSGKTTPRADILHVLAQVLEVSPAWLSERTPPGRPPPAAAIRFQNLSQNTVKSEQENIP